MAKGAKAADALPDGRGADGGVRFVGDGLTWLAGVPARDLSAAEFAGLTDGERVAVLGCGLYVVDEGVAVEGGKVS